MENFLHILWKTIAIPFFIWYNNRMEKIDFEKYEYIIKEERKKEFEEYEKLLLDYNSRYNLTTITEKKDIFYKHFLDSVVGESFFLEEKSVAEIGSGAGFPSIPLKIIRPDLSFSLFESVGKKCEFLRVVVEKLGFSNMYIYNLRAEDATRKEEFREKFDFTTARAVARMNSLSEYALPFIKVGGKFIAYKSGEKEEIYEADSAYKALGGKREEILSYSLPENYGDRTLAVIKKVSLTPNKYPRGQGKERKSPL